MKGTAKSDDKLPKELVGLAGEHLVAGELFRRGGYAQVTLGNRKKVDLLIDGKKLARVEVKSKQGSEWPGVKGISPNEDARFLVFVDFHKKRVAERPDFYVMNSKNWGEFIRTALARLIKDGILTVDEDNVPHWKDGYTGSGVKPNQIEDCKERWEKILNAVGVVSE